MTRRGPRPERGRRGARGGLGRELARPGVAEVGRVRPLDADPLVAGLAAGDGPSAADHRRLEPVREPRDEALRQLEADHRRLDRRDVEGGPPPGRGPGVGVEQHPAGGRDPVPRLADAAGVEQHAPAVEAEPGAGRPGSSSRAARPPRCRRPAGGCGRAGRTGSPSAPSLARATGVEVMYSQVGSRGLPWTSRKPSRSSVSGSAASQARVSAEIALRVHSAARRASTLNDSISRPPSAAASWLPRTPIAPRSRRRATTSSGWGP